MIISFNDAMDISGTTPKSLLLGNGFSIQANQIFRYTYLHEKSNLSNSLNQLFTKLDTHDFEIVIYEIEHALNVLKIYNISNTKELASLESDSRTIRAQFASAIINHHATHETIFNLDPNKTRKSCAEFLSSFKKIFTTNYDLLLYWEIMYHDNDFTIPKYDGFRKNQPKSACIWHPPYQHTDGKDQNVYYLHGSLFLSEYENHTIKETKESATLLDNLKERIITNEKLPLPLIILEGSHESKLAKIYRNPYLNNAYDSLNMLEGDLFIFGHSLKPCDEHIITAIKNSKVKNIFVSLHGANKSIGTATENLKNDNKDRKVFLYNAETASVWV